MDDLKNAFLSLQGERVWLREDDQYLPSTVSSCSGGVVAFATDYGQVRASVSYMCPFPDESGGMLVVIHPFEIRLKPFRAKSGCKSRTLIRSFHLFLSGWLLYCSSKVKCPSLLDIRGHIIDKDITRSAKVIKHWGIGLVKNSTHQLIFLLAHETLQKPSKTFN